MRGTNIEQDNSPMRPRMTKTLEIFFSLRVMKIKYELKMIPVSMKGQHKLRTIMVSVDKSILD